MKKFVTLLVVIAIGVFFYTFSKAVYYIPPDDLVVAQKVTERVSTPKVALATNSSGVTPAKVAKVEKEETVYPSHLSIPAIKVEANIKQVGITKKGNVSAPYNFTSVGWYKYGTFPGDIGNAILDGHVDNGIGLAGVFSNLKNLKTGDDIYITISSTETAHFVVTSSDTYNFKTNFIYK